MEVVVKILRYFYKVRPEVPQEERSSLLYRTQQNFSPEGWYKCERQGNLLVLQGVHKEWTEEYTRSGIGFSCPLNSAWGIRGLTDEFQIVKIVIEYDNALLPWRDRRGDVEWLNGESYWGRGDNLRSITLTCLPTPKTVTISAAIDPEKDQDEQRIELIQAVNRIEKMILRTKTLIRLARATRATPLNRGRLDRYISVLYGLIGQA